MFVCAGRSDGIQADGCFHEYGPQQVTGSFGADFVTDVVSGRLPSISQQRDTLDVDRLFTRAHACMDAFNRLPYSLSPSD